YRPKQAPFVPDAQTPSGVASGPPVTVAGLFRIQCPCTNPEPELSIPEHLGLYSLWATMKFGTPSRPGQGAALYFRVAEAEVPPHPNLLYPRCTSVPLGPTRYRAHHLRSRSISPSQPRRARP